MNINSLRKTTTPDLSCVFCAKDLIRKVIVLSLFFLFIGSMTSCKKDDTKKPEPEATASNPVNKGTFVWREGSANSISADSAYYYASFTTIFAFKTGLINSVEINLSALSVGSYSISSATGNDLTYVTSSTTYTASSGSLSITAAANSKVSGNFSATLTGGTLTAITGTFTDILQR